MSWWCGGKGAFGCQLDFRFCGNDVGVADLDCVMTGLRTRSCLQIPRLLGGRKVDGLTDPSPREQASKLWKSASLVCMLACGCKQNELCLVAIIGRSFSTEVAVSSTKTLKLGVSHTTLHLSLSHCYCYCGVLISAPEEFLVENLNLDSQLADLSRGSSLNAQLRRGHQ